MTELQFTNAIEWVEGRKSNELVLIQCCPTNFQHLFTSCQRRPEPTINIDITGQFIFHITIKRHKALVFHQYPIGKFRLPDKAKGSTPKTPGGPKGVRHPNRVETFASINFRFPKIIQKSQDPFACSVPLMNPKSPDAGTEVPHNIKFKTCAFL